MQYPYHAELANKLNCEMSVAILVKSENELRAL